MIGGEFFLVAMAYLSPKLEPISLEVSLYVSQAACEEQADMLRNISLPDGGRIDSYCVPIERSSIDTQVRRK